MLTFLFLCCTVKIKNRMNRHYTPEHFLLIDRAEGFNDLLQVAQDSLTKMNSKEIIQICGPISTGALTLPERKAIFAKTIQVFVDNKYPVFNQLVFGDKMHLLKEQWIKKHSHPEDAYYMPILEEFYLPLFKTGIIKTFYFIPGWQHSVGTKWEYEQAQQLGIPSIFLPPDWTEHFNVELLAK